MNRIPFKLAGIAGAIGVFAAVCVGGWQLHWWTALHGADNRYQVNTHTQAYQASLVSQLRDTAEAYRLAVDPGQKTALKSTFCATYLDLTPNTVPNDVLYAHDTTFSC
ncbi:hypothetical protein ACIP5Y_21310 [Nocardia sp. NPDC088792]|uniref:hypothetical protein n=1 Tax=Nocardia sp. NPDC088792 TaxID=3364332 RepID=UPI00381A55DA